MATEPNIRQFLKVLTVVCTVFIVLHVACQSDAAIQKKQEGKDSLIVMESYTIRAPSGANWKVDIDRRKESVQFQRVENDMQNQKSVRVATSIQVFKKKTEARMKTLDEKEVAAQFIKNEEERIIKDLVTRDALVLKHTEKGTTTKGGKKLHFLNYRATKENLTVEAVFYLYFPPDYLQDRRFYVFFMSEAYTKELHKADLTTLDALIASFKNVKPLTLSVPTADELLDAASEGDIDLMKELLDKGVSPNAKGPDGWTALMIGASKGSSAMVKLLLDRGADANAENSKGQTPLIFAAHWGHQEIAHLLVDRGANVNAQMNDGWTALIDAIQMGKGDVARFLIEKGAAVNQKTQNGWTALFAAVEGSHVDVVKLLIGRGADVNARDAQNNSVLKVAKTKGNPEIVSLLTEAGAKE
jgi:hypothetical protein